MYGKVQANPDFGKLWLQVISSMMISTYKTKISCTSKLFKEGEKLNDKKNPPKRKKKIKKKKNPEHKQ